MYWSMSAMTHTEKGLQCKHSFNRPECAQRGPARTMRQVKGPGGLCRTSHTTDVCVRVRVLLQPSVKVCELAGMGRCACACAGARANMHTCARSEENRRNSPSRVFPPLQGTLPTSSASSAFTTTVRAPQP